MKYVLRSFLVHVGSTKVSVTFMCTSYIGTQQDNGSKTRQYDVVSLGAGLQVRNVSKSLLGLISIPISLCTVGLHDEAYVIICFITRPAVVVLLNFI